MIDQTDDSLISWLSGVCPQAEVSLSLPEGAPGARPQVVCYLLNLAASPPARALDATKAAPLQFSARYLVMVQSRDRHEEHSLLGSLVLAALDNPSVQVDLGGIASDWWLALRQLPRPAFILQVLLRQERPDPGLRLVREIVLREAPLVNLIGRVLGPEAIPLAGARLELPAMRLSTYSDQRGRFSFTAVPAKPLPKLLRIIARGQQLDVDPGELLGRDRTLTITFPITET